MEYYDFKANFLTLKKHCAAFRGSARLYQGFKYTNAIVYRFLRHLFGSLFQWPLNRQASKRVSFRIKKYTIN
jgi:hypothetical protein